MKLNSKSHAWMIVSTLTEAGDQNISIPKSDADELESSFQKYWRIPTLLQGLADRLKLP